MFAPWLIPYYPENMKDAPANWIQQFTASNAVLLPFSDIYIESAGKISQVYYLCLQFLLEMLPASNQMLGLMFNWYNVNFASKLVPHHVLNHAHNLLMKLPWDRFKPLPVHIEAYNRILQQVIIRQIK